MQIVNFVKSCKKIPISTDGDKQELMIIWRECCGFSARKQLFQEVY